MLSYVQDSAFQSQTHKVACSIFTYFWQNLIVRQEDTEQQTDAGSNMQSKPCEDN